MDPYYAEIRLFPFDFTPRGWVPCDGRLLPISQNSALFSVIGTTYGGDGVTSFAVPDLRGRSVVHPGTTTRLGDQRGTPTHTLTPAELPVHQHAGRATTAAADRGAPSGARWATTTEPQYAPAAQVAMAGQTAASAGDRQPVENRPPSLALTYAIATEGLFPSPDSGMAAEPLCAEIRLFAGNRLPGGWAACDGTQVPVNQNQMLFALLGATFGGDGRTIFALPDLRDRTPVHVGGGGGAPDALAVRSGERGGTATTTLRPEHLPAHTHTVPATGTRGTTGNPSGATAALAQQGRTVRARFSSGVADTTTGPVTAAAGGGQARNNLSPVLGITAMIALVGIFPPRP